MEKNDVTPNINTVILNRNGIPNNVFLGNFVKDFQVSKPVRDHVEELHN